VVGRNVREGDVLFTLFTKRDLLALREFAGEIPEEEIELGKRIVEMVRKMQSSSHQ